MHGLVHRIAGLVEILEQLLAHRVQIRARVMLIDEILGLLQLRCRVVAIRVQNTVLHLRVIDDQDDQHAVLRQRQEFDLPQSDLGGAGDSDHARHSREIGQHARDRADEGTGALILPFQLLAYPLDVAVAGLPVAHERVHEHAVALRRRYAARRGVRRGHETHILEISHDVANRRRTEVQPRIFGQGPRSHRLPIADIALDQHA